MFGYVTVNRETLSPESEARYRAHYCGLCRSLRDRHGLTGALTLSNDMTFLSILLGGLYEPEEQSGEERCLNRPLRPHGWLHTEATDYAADMNVMLAWHLCMDDWRDEKKLISRAEALLIRKAADRVEAQYPEKCEFVRDMIRALSDVEQKGADGDLDRPTNLVGELIGELFPWKDDQWKEPLTHLGAALGRFIYLMDAWEDLPRDGKKHCFNPFLPLADRADLEDLAQDMLTMHIAECTAEFEDLPVLRDADLIRNILYSGVWSRYALMQKQKEKRKKHG